MINLNLDVINDFDSYIEQKVAKKLLVLARSRGCFGCGKGFFIGIWEFVFAYTKRISTQVRNMWIFFYVEKFMNMSNNIILIVVIHE